jgi:hypothetical protein
MEQKVISGDKEVGSGKEQKQANNTEEESAT